MRRLGRTLMGTMMVVIAGCVTASQDTAPSPEAGVIELTESVHFQTRDGSEQVIQAGAYQVDAALPDALVIADVNGTVSATVKAHAVPHDFDVPFPLALAAPDGEDTRHIVLLMPKGQGLDAVGSISGIQSRASASTGISRFTMQQSIQTLAPSKLALMNAPDLCAGAIPPPPVPPQTATIHAPMQTNRKATGFTSKAGMGQSIPPTDEFGPNPIPDVVDWQPKQKIPAGRELTIRGRNLDPTRFVAKIGETVLTPIVQTPSEIRVAVPAWLRSFQTPLVVYHRGGTPRTLEMYYEVFDPVAKITRVVPESFSQGDLVTLCGVSLSHLSLIENVRTNPGGGIPQSEMRKLALIGQPNGIYQNYHWVEMLNPAAAPSGDRLTFVASNLFKSIFRQADASQTGAYTDIVSDPAPPSPVTGPLSFRSEANPTNSRDVLAPNPVTWKTGGPKIVKLGVNPNASGFRVNESFVILPAVLPNNATFPRLAQLLVEGYNLSGQYRIGTVPLRASFSGPGLPSDETKGLLSVPGNATSGQVCGTRNGATTCWPQPVTVVPGPVLASLPWQLPAPPSLPASYNLQSPRWPLALRTTYVINGLYLAASAVPGLTYALEIPDLMIPSRQIAGGAPTFEQCNMVFTILEHTASRIQFRIGDPSKPGPSSTCMAILTNWYFNQAAQGGPTLRLIARYGGQQSDLAYFNVYFTQ